MENLETEDSTDNLKIEFKTLTEEERKSIARYIGKCRSCTQDGPFTVHNKAKFINYDNVTSVIAAVHCKCGQNYSMLSRDNNDELMTTWQLTLM